MEMKFRIINSLGCPLVVLTPKELEDAIRLEVFEEGDTIEVVSDTYKEEE
jgi:hypothetical protein